MTSAALLRHLAFAVGLALLSALVVRLMISMRVMDTPEARKAHSKATPKGGGVGVVAAFLVGILVLYRFAEFARVAEPYFLGVIQASIASRFTTSMAVASTVAPFFWQAACTPASRSIDRPPRNSVTPGAANSSANAVPMPELAPVIRIDWNRFTGALACLK